MSTDALLARAGELDAADPLARWRDEFDTPDPDLAYLDGDTLMSHGSPEAALRVVGEIGRAHV